jgi:hypothetical protein
MDEKIVIPLPPKDGPQQFTMLQVLPPAPACVDWPWRANPTAR